MEFVEGQTLDALMQQRRLAIREILRLGIQIAEALDAAHARQIVHRDIKPGNIMVDRRAQAKVLDFGLAKRFVQDGLSDTAALSSALTQTGMLIGTPHYMSPEQVLGRQLDHRSDIFSLGVVLYELIAGQKPFLGKTVGETINNVVNQRPDSLGHENPHFQPTLDGIVLKCLEKEPEKRYAAAKLLAAELTRLKNESEQTSAANVRDETRVVRTDHSSGTRVETTKLWQLAGKASQPAHRSAAIMAGLIVLLVAAAFGFYRVNSLGGRIVFSIAEVLILAVAAYWWFFRRTGSTPRNQPG